MSLLSIVRVTHNYARIGNSARLVNGINHSRLLHTTDRTHCKLEEGPQKSESAVDKDQINTKDRTRIIPVETSIRYMASSSYKQTYGDSLVWEKYRRNHKGMFPPRKTRKTCIRQGVISTGNPCPICRDEYLVLHPENTTLLKQFISPQTGQLLSYSKTGVCQKKHLELSVALHKAWNSGRITYDAPFREFDYSEYYDKDNNSCSY